MTTPLDEAAEEYGKQFDYGNRPWAEEDFKSGAQWQLKRVLEMLRENYVNGGKGMADWLEKQCR